VGRTIEYHWQLVPVHSIRWRSAPRCSLPRRTSSADVPQLHRSRTGRRIADAGNVLADIRRFNRLIMQWGPCARWIKACMQILRLPGWEGGLRKRISCRRTTKCATSPAPVAPARAGNRRDGACRRPRRPGVTSPTCRNVVSLRCSVYADGDQLPRPAGALDGGEAVAQEFHLSPVQLGYLFRRISGLRAGQHPDGHAGGPVRRTAYRGGGHRGLVRRDRLHWRGMNYLMLIASRFVMGGGEAVTNPCGARIVREWFPASERGTVNAVFNAGAFAGPALSAVVVGI